MWGGLDDMSRAYSQRDLREAWRFAGTKKYALVACNGTATLHSGHIRCRGPQGTEVIVPSVTWHASITPSSLQGLPPYSVMLIPKPTVLIQRMWLGASPIAPWPSWSPRLWHPAQMDAFRS